MRVLIISRECWRDDSNEGNVLTSLFAGQPMEFANIYCKPGLPRNSVCGRYFQLTDKMALENVLHHEPVGRAFFAQQDAEQTGDRPGRPETENRAFYDFFRRNNWEVFYSARELLWRMADFESGALDQFVLEFHPDLVFAPLCYSNYVLRLQRYVIGLAGCPAVTYIYDDLYSLRQFRLSPVYWLNRFSLRRAIRKTLPYDRYAYTMSEEQAREYHRLLGMEMRVLRKAAGKIASGPRERKAEEPVRFIYAGGIYYGRDRTLMQVADALRKQKAGTGRLDVYTNSPLTKGAEEALNDGVHTFLHPAVPAEELRNRYAQSDVAIHAESFRLKFRLLTRLSFSTKIVDCLASGCAVLAIGPGMNAGMQYLQKNDAAICVDDPGGIAPAMEQLIKDPALMQEYRKKALDCARANHDQKKIQQIVYKDFTGVIEG